VRRLPSATGQSKQICCVDGPEFDASLVNFDVLMQRNAMYRGQECHSLQAFSQHRQQELAEHRAGWPPRKKRPRSCEQNSKNRGSETGLEAQEETHHV